MIVGERKPFEEIRQMVAGYKRILVAGCGTCVAVCWAGGEREVGILASLLRLAFKGNGLEVLEATVERQCERECVDELSEQVSKVDAVLSLACGVGVQLMAEMFPKTPVYPALNTKFIGVPEREGLWNEWCAACGDCMLAYTGGICPVVRCAKGLLNGPCGGTNNGKCEVDPEKDCAWTLIYRRLEAQGKLSLMRKYYPPKNYNAVMRPGRVSTRPK
jgi:ferredoxin